MRKSMLLDATLHAGAAWTRVWCGLRQGWRFLRKVSGDDAYERDLEHVARCHPDDAPLNRAGHFRVRQERKWNRISRCC